MSATALNRILDGTGPIKFLGCSVINFTANAGWGNDNSTFTVELVEDCSVNDRFWGRDTEIIGTAKYFDLRGYPWFTNFAFGGIVTSWTENKGTSGQTFTVNMSDPKQLLSGVTVLTDSYSWYPIYDYNFYNTLAKYESFVLLGYCSEFGKARSDQKGMNYQNILKALLTIGFEDQGDPWGRFHCVSPTKANGVTFGSADFVIDIGLTWDKNTNLFTATRVDHVPIGPDYYKVTGSENLLDLFNNICEATGRNLFVQLDWDPVLFKNVIVVRCVHLVDTFAGNYHTLLNTFDGVATQLSYGKEFNNPRTRNMIIGDNVSYLSQATSFTPCLGFYTQPSVVDGVVIDNRTPIVPYKNSRGENIRPDGIVDDKCGFWFLVDITKLQYALYKPLLTGVGSVTITQGPDQDPEGNLVEHRNWTMAGGVPLGYAWISEADLQSALASEDMWRTRASAGRRINNSVFPDFDMSPIYSLNWHMQQNYPNIMSLVADSLRNLAQLKSAENVALPISDIVVNTYAGQQQAHENQMMVSDLKAIYNFVLDLAQTHYGKTFVYKLNETICAHFADPSTDAGALVYSSEPTNEGGWIDPGYTALGLSDPYLSFFRADDGRVQCFARFNGFGNSDFGDNNTIQSTVATPYYSGCLDISELEGSDYISDGTTVWMKGDVDGTVYFVRDSSSYSGYTPVGVISFNSPSFAKTDRRLIQNLTEQALSNFFLLYKSSAADIDPDIQASYRQIVGVQILDPGTNVDPSVVDVPISVPGGVGGQIVIKSVSNGAALKVEVKNGGKDYNGASFQFNTVGGLVLWVQVSESTKDKYCGVPSAFWKNNPNQAPRSDTPGFLDINHKGMIRKAIMPDSAAIPMKSNVLVYGPFFSRNFLANYGGVNVEQDKDFAPWNFGSSALMIAAGDARAQTAFDNGEIPLVISENGNVSVPGLPLYMLASQVIVAGVAVGPIVNSVNVSFGSNGISTSYDFKTFSRKFGNLTAIQTDQIKQIATNRQKNIKFIRDAFIGISQTYRKLIRSQKNQARVPRQESLSEQNTTHRVFVGENTPWTVLHPDEPNIRGTGERPVVVLEGLDKLQYDLAKSYEKKAIMSLDGLYSPTSLNGDGGLPRVPILEASVTPIESGRRRYPVNPIPPAYYEYTHPTLGQIDLPLNAINLERSFFNPMQNPFQAFAHPYHSGAGYGHNIEVLGRGFEPPLSGMMNSFYPAGASDKYSTDYRFVSHRGPMMLHQWGYDTQGKPIPNEADDPVYASNGIFTSGALKERFLTDWLQKPSTWPVAPVDLRFDRSRGMWVAPPEYKMVVVEVKEDITPYATGLGRLVNTTETGRNYSPTIVNSEGATVPDTQTKIIIEDRLGTAAVSGDKAYAYFDTFTSTYLMMGAGGGDKQVIGKYSDEWKCVRNTTDINNAVKTVYLWEVTCPSSDPDCWQFTQVMHDVGGTPVQKTVNAINLFANVSGQNAWCMLSLIKGKYFLTAAECSTSTT